MRLLLARLREIIWPAVLSVVFSAAAVVVALVAPGSVALPLALGSAAITMAILANRA